MSIVITEAESRTCLLIFIIRLNRVFQASGLPDNGKSSVAQAHKLAEAAGFKQRRHQESITGCVNLMRKFI